jgi:DNA-damage-inducible protein D
MKTAEIKQLFEQFEAVASTYENIECRSARELQHLLGYNKWENFEKVINKAKDECKHAVEEIEDHFPDVRKMVQIGSGAQKEISDILLTRYACYLIAQNGDTRKNTHNSLSYSPFTA